MFMRVRVHRVCVYVCVFLIVCVRDSRKIRRMTWHISFFFFFVNECVGVCVHVCVGCTCMYLGLCVIVCVRDSFK